MSGINDNTWIGTTSKLLSLSLFIAAIALSYSSSYAFEFDAGDMKIRIGGYAKLHFIYDTDGSVSKGPNDGDIWSAWEIQLNDHTDAEKEDFRMHAKESRIAVKTETDSRFGTMETYFEGDSVGNIGGSESFTNGRGFRMRHFFGRIKEGNHSITAGQTWSTFMDFASLSRSLDFAVDPAVTIIRQPLLSYQYSLNKEHYFAVALENPDRGLTSAGPINYLRNPGSSENIMPDLIAKYFFASKWGHFSPRIVVRRFEIDGDSEFGWGAGVGASINLPKKHRILVGATFGDGIGRYGSIGAPTGAGLTDGGKVETAKLFGCYGGFSFKLREDIQLNLGAGYAEIDDDAFEGPSSFYTDNAPEKAFSYHGNIVWNPYERLELALGFLDGELEVMDGREGDSTRFQSYIKFIF